MLGKCYIQLNFWEEQDVSPLVRLHVQHSLGIPAEQLLGESRLVSAKIQAPFCERADVDTGKASMRPVGGVDDSVRCRREKLAGHSLEITHVSVLGETVRGGHLDVGVALAEQGDQGLEPGKGVWVKGQGSLGP